MFTYTVHETLAILSESGLASKRLTITSWSNYPAKLDLRTWIQTGNGLSPGKGTTLTDAEAYDLTNALVKYFTQDAPAEDAQQAE